MCSMTNDWLVPLITKARYEYVFGRSIDTLPEALVAAVLALPLEAKS